MTSRNDKTQSGGEAKSSWAFLKPRPPKWAYLLFVIGASTLTMRTVLDSSFANSAAFYLPIPFLIAVLLHHFVGYAESATAFGRYRNHLRNATVVLLASSAFLFEGFLCILMAMPIYYLFTTIGFLFSHWSEKQRDGRRGQMRAYALPLLVAVLSLEGTSQATTIPRSSSVTHRVTVPDSPDVLMANMAQPISFDAPRQWFIALFPLPTEVEAGSLSAGDIHKLKFVYKKWIFTNKHEGQMRLRIDQVGDDFVRTSVVRNDSYLANYMNITGTEVRLVEQEDGSTEIVLTISYDRQLDPVWYFGPLQHYAMEQSAKYLAQTVISRRPADG